MAYIPKRKQSLEESLLQLRGDEPRVRKETYKVDMLILLNWYNTNWEEKDYRKSAEQYIKKMSMKEYAQCVSRSSFLEIRQVGVLGRLLLTGQYVDINDIERLSLHLEKLKTKYIKTSPEPTAMKTVAVAPVSIQERILENARTHAAEIDAAIDDFILNKSTSFTAKSYLKSNQVSGPVAKKVGEFYNTTYKELQEAQAGKCDQLKEGYSHLSKVELRRLVAFVQSIIDDCTQQAVSAKSQRKPRARKAKPASVIVNKMKYLREYPELNLKSIDPAKIIGSTELWVYVPEKRKLIVYRGADNGYLGVSGMSITNYDLKTSEVKTLRKPDEFFKGLSSMGKRAMGNAWKAVRAKVSNPRARINEEMILLAVN
jgi:hypothetical protein